MTLWQPKQNTERAVDWGMKQNEFITEKKN